MREPDHLSELIDAVADGQPIDWQRVESIAATPAEAAALRNLRAVAAIAEAECARPVPEGSRPATRVLHYTLVQQVDEGGMGLVWKATDTLLARNVALKFIRPETAFEVESQARIKREARMAASLSHPNICTVYSVHETVERLDLLAGDRLTSLPPQTTFVAMELIDGRTLHDLLEESGPPPVHRLLDIATQLAQGLAAAHEKQVVHRDLKPRNVMVTGDGTVKILDFGLARATVAAVGSSPGDPSVSVSLQNTLLGTPSYMSPEQVRGAEVDVRSDIFSFGVVLYELASGRRPFPGDTPTEVVAKILEHEPEALLALRPDLPPGFGQLVTRCLQKDSAYRYQRILDVIWALEDLRAVQPRRRRLFTDRVRKPALAAGLSVLAVAAIIVAALVLRPISPLRASDRSRSPDALVRTPIRFQVDTGSGPLWTGGNSLAVSPVEPIVVFTAYDGVNTRLFRRTFSRNRPEALKFTEGARAPFFSPDGKWIGFIRERAILRVPAGGGPAQTIHAGKRPSMARWTSAGTVLFSDHGLWSVPVAGGERTKLYSPAKDDWISSVEGLPGDRGVLIGIGGPGMRSYDEPRIILLSLDTGQVRFLTNGASPRYRGGYLLYCRDGFVRATRLDPGTFEVTGSDFIVEDIGPYQASQRCYYDVSTDLDTFAYYPARAHAGPRLAWLDERGRQSIPIEEPLAYEVRASPDGRLAVTSGELSHALSIFDVDQKRRTIRLDDLDDVHWPTWRRTARDVTLTFSSGVDVGRDIYEVAIDRPDDVQRLIAPDPRRSSQNKVDRHPNSWSPDGQTLAFQERATEGNWDLWLYSAADGSLRPWLTSPRDERQAQFSPGGDRLAYVLEEGGRKDVYVRPVEGLEQRGVKVTDDAGGHSPVWSPDGSRLFFRTRDEIYVVAIRTAPEFRTGLPELVAHAPLIDSSTSGAFGLGYDIDPRSGRFILIEEEPLRTVHVVVNWRAEFAARAGTR